MSAITRWVAVVVLMTVGLVGCSSSSRHQASGTTLGSSSTTRPPVTSATSRPPSLVAPVGKCVASSLRVHGGRQGDGPGASGDLILTETGTTPCVLSGYPTVTLIDQAGLALATASGPPTIEQRARTLHPGASADLVLFWSNWCAKAPGPLWVRLALPAGGSVTGPFNGPPDYNFVPSCLSPGQPSKLSITYAYNNSASSVPNS